MNRNKIIEGLEEIQKHLDSGYSFAISWKSELIRDAIELLKEQEGIIKQYQKADGFLFAHGWKWEDG